MKRFLKAYFACLFLLGLFLVLCMGGGMSDLLWPFMFLGHPYLSWMLSALALAALVSIWQAQKERMGVLEKRIQDLEGRIWDLENRKL